MSTSSIRNKAKNMISPLFTTMGHFHSEHHKVIFMCTTLERERTEKVLMASELKRNTARLPGQPTGSEPLLCCAVLTCQKCGVAYTGTLFSRCSSCLSTVWGRKVSPQMDSGPCRRCCKVVCAFRRECFQLGSLRKFGGRNSSWFYSIEK